MMTPPPDYIGTKEHMAEAEAFKSYLSGLGCQPATCTIFYTHVREFLSYVKKPFCTVERTDIEAFYTHLQERPCRNRAGGLSTPSINHYLCALRSFFSWHQTTGSVRTNPMSAIKPLQVECKSRYPLSQAQVAALFEASESLKESALLHLYYSLGLRRSEGVALNLRDVHFKTCMVYVRSGKGGKRRAVPMPEKVSQALRNM